MAYKQRKRKKKEPRQSIPEFQISTEPVSKKRSTSSSEEEWDDVPESSDWKDNVWMYGSLAGIGTFIVCMVIQLGLKGPAFLVMYGILFLGLAIAAGVLKSMGLGVAGAIIALITFECVGIGRIYYGSSIGMQKFGLLGSGMLWGGIILLVVGTAEKGSGSGSSSGFFSSCGSSCGGGGCGGGGCGGGCGGCS